jgi:hypothetical protein
MKFAIIAIAVVLGVIRPFLSPHPVSLQGSYEALAHLFWEAWLAHGWSQEHAGYL